MKQQQEPASSDWAPDIARPGLRSFQPVLSRYHYGSNDILSALIDDIFNSDKDKSTN